MEFVHFICQMLGQDKAKRSFMVFESNFF